MLAPVGCLLARADEVTLDTVRAEYDTGKSFVYDKTDVYGRPVLVITASKHNIGERGQHLQQVLHWAAVPRKQPMRPCVEGDFMNGARTAVWPLAAVQCCLPHMNDVSRAASICAGSTVAGTGCLNQHCALEGTHCSRQFSAQ